MKFNLTDIQEKTNKITTIQQDLEIMGNQFLYPWKDITALLGAVSLPYMNKLLANMEIVQNTNDIYQNFLQTWKLENTPILKDISINGILSGLAYFLLLYSLSKPYGLDKKAKDLKVLGITDNKKTTGNTIIPIRDTISFKNPSIRKLVCYSNGVLPKDFKENDNLERLSKNGENLLLM